MTVVAAFGEIGDHIGRLDQPRRFDGQQVRITWAGADAEQAGLRGGTIGHHRVLPRPGEGVDSGGGDRAAAHAATDGGPGNRPGGALGERLFRFRRADEADRHADDRRRFGRPVGEHFKQMEQGRRRVADDHQGAGQVVAPQFHRRRRAGGAAPAGEVRRAGVAQGADHPVIGR